MKNNVQGKNRSASVGWPVHLITFVFIAIFVFYVVITNQDNVNIYNNKTDNLDSGWVDTEKISIHSPHFQQVLWY